MSYPASQDTFDTHSDGQVIRAADINALGTAVAAIESELGASPAGSAGTVAARLTAIEESIAGPLANVEVTGFADTASGTATALTSAVVGPVAGGFLHLSAPLVVTAAAPASGQFQVELSCALSGAGGYSSSTVTGELAILRDGELVGTSMEITRPTDANQRITMSRLDVGLTPGHSYTYSVTIRQVSGPGAIGIQGAEWAPMVLALT